MPPIVRKPTSIVDVAGSDSVTRYSICGAVEELSTTRPPEIDTTGPLLASSSRISASPTAPATPFAIAPVGSTTSEKISVGSSTSSPNTGTATDWKRSPASNVTEPDVAS